MGAAAVPIIGGLSLVQGIMSNQSQQKSADKANRNAKSLVDRQTKLFDTLLASVDAQKASGAFDPTKRLQQLDADTQHYSGLDQTNAAASARVMGYRPGDSAPLTAGRGISDAYRINYGREADNIRTSARREERDAYASVNSGALNPGISYNQGQQQNAQAGMQSPSGFLSSLMPFLQQTRQATPGALPDIQFGKKGVSSGYGRRF